jgi:hypothetical protein
LDKGPNYLINKPSRAKEILENAVIDIVFADLTQGNVKKDIVCAVCYKPFEMTPKK